MDRTKRKFAPFRAMLACGRDFCQHTSMHGFIHIAAPNRWWGERLLWAFATAAAIWGAVKISQGQWQRYNENPTVVALEKDFRSWQFCMPGLTVCAKNRVDEKKLPSVIKKYWGVDSKDAKYARYEHFVRDVANSSMLHLTDLLLHDGEDLEVDLYQLTVDVLPELNLKPTWSIGSPPDWFPVMTEVGACYATNSLAIPDDAIVKPSINKTKMFPLTCKYSSLTCLIVIEVPVPIIDRTAKNRYNFRMMIADTRYRTKKKKKVNTNAKNADLSKQLLFFLGPPTSDIGSNNMYTLLRESPEMERIL